MQLHLSILEKIIELDGQTPQSLRHLLDDIGLEVKAVEQRPSGEIIFNIETLANRGDHIGTLGAAREISARTLSALSIPPVAGSLPDRKASLSINIKTPLCTRYAALEMVLPANMLVRPEIARVLGEGAKLNERHAIVHTLNYLLIELGQPMHAFDRDKVEGEIIVDELSAPEQIVALDGVAYTVPVGSIVIRDRKKVIAVAGVIGCQNSCVTPSTERVIIESATFDPVAVRKTARAMGLSTDASFAFERGCDLEMVLFALKRLVYLVASDAGNAGSAQVVGLSYQSGKSPEARKISLSLAELRHQLNLQRLEAVEVTTRLKLLGYQIEIQQPSTEIGSKSKAKKPDTVFSVTVPSWRVWDVFNQEDLIEDFARSHGLSAVKIELPPLMYDLPAQDSCTSLRQAVDPVLHGNGFFEVITKGFTSSEDVKVIAELDPKLAQQHLALINSVEGAHSHMKLTNILHLGRLAEANLRMGVKSVKVYEYGRLFQKSPRANSLYQFERDMLQLAVAGRWQLGEWQKPESRAELARMLTGVISAVAKALHVEFSVGESHNALLHPGVQASLKFGRSIVGVIGVVHPVVSAYLELRSDLIYCELEVEKLFALFGAESIPVVPSDLPSIERDLTLKIGQREQAGKVIRYIKESGPSNLREIFIIDDFSRSGEDLRRVTFRAVFQNSERTLAATEVDQTVAQILEVLKAKHSIELAN